MMGVDTSALEDVYRFFENIIQAAAVVNYREATITCSIVIFNFSLILGG